MFYGKRYFTLYATELKTGVFACEKPNIKPFKNLIVFFYNNIVD